MSTTRVPICHEVPRQRDRSSAKVFQARDQVIDVLIEGASVRPEGKSWTVMAASLRMVSGHVRTGHQRPRASGAAADDAADLFDPLTKRAGQTVILGQTKHALEFGDLENFRSSSGWNHHRDH